MTVFGLLQSVLHIEGTADPEVRDDRGEDVRAVDLLAQPGAVAEQESLF